MNYSIPRILFAFVLGVIFGAVTTEIAYLSLQRENRAPKTIELIIPAGTAELIRQGDAPPTIPQDMRFVVGDILRVINEDSENHQLGLLYIPAKSSASLKLESVENMTMECSFQSTNFLDITVQEPVTWWTRLRGYFYAGFPLGTLFAVYSGLIVKKKKDESVS
ncbi:MAG: hypothetical protein JNJ43_04100 [Anaerolineales bacterium]|nr:hypothetical protein [Anaerolineales bacterium]